MCDCRAIPRIGAGRPATRLGGLDRLADCKIVSLDAGGTHDIQRFPSPRVSI
jgi:hypothetical protein